MVIPQTVAFDERQSPEGPFPWPDHEWVVVGPRTAVAQATAIRDAGSKLIVKVQPVRWFIDGKPYMDSRWDRILSTLPMLPQAISLDLPGEGMGGSMILDFASAMTQNLSGALLQLALGLGASGVMFDYGCKDIGWIAPGYDWLAWGDGYRKYRMSVAAKLPVWNCCNRAQGFGSLMFENIQAQGSDTLYPPNYRQVFSAEGRNMYLIQNDDLRHRRIICGMALANGALVNYRPKFATNRWDNQIPYEMVL